MSQDKLMMSRELYQDTTAGGKDYVITVLEIGPSLFQVMTAWGRTGRTLQKKVVGEYVSFTRALDRLESICSTKLRRGYKTVCTISQFVPGPETAEAAAHAPSIPSVAVDINCDAIAHQAWF